MVASVEKYGRQYITNPTKMSPYAGKQSGLGGVLNSTQLQQKLWHEEGENDENQCDRKRESRIG